MADSVSTTQQLSFHSSITSHAGDNLWTSLAIYVLCAIDKVGRAAVTNKLFYLNHMGRCEKRVSGTYESLNNRITQPSGLPKQRLFMFS